MKEYPNYYAIIPASVRYCKNLKANEKLLYGEITTLSDKKGYCFAGNNYFAELYDVSKWTISGWINNLVREGFITSTMIYKQNSKEISERRLSITPSSHCEKPHIAKNSPIVENHKTPIVENHKTPIVENHKTPIVENHKGNNTSKINNTRLNYIPRPSDRGDSDSLKINSSFDKTKQDKPTPKKDIYLSLSKKLFMIVQTYIEENGGRKPKPSDIKKWSVPIKRLHSADKVEIKEIKRCLKWYAENISGKFTPEVRSGEAFRKKFNKLLSAMQRGSKQEKELTTAQKRDKLLTPMGREFKIKSTVC